jgi:hypothetical protein
MAAMDMRRARAIAEQKIKSGQNRGLGLEDLVQQIIAESAGAGAPGTAIGAALAPVTLTPAATAPMQPGVPFVAPKPTTEMVPAPQEQELPVAEAPQRAAPRPSAFRPMFETAKARLGQMQAAVSDAVANKQPISLADKARLGAQEELVRDLEQRALAQENAQIPEEVRAALANQEARLGRREELLQEAKARSPWEALLAGGAALAQGRRGESFGEALTRGLQAGLQQFGSARRANEEGVEALGEARDETALRRLELSEKARTDASNLMDTQNTLQAQAIARKAALIKAGVDEETAEAEVQASLANAKLAQFRAANAPAEFALDTAYKKAQIGDLGSRAGERKREMTANQEYNAEQNFIATDEKMREALEEYKADYEQAGGNKASMDAAKYAKYKAILNRREAMRLAFQKTFGRPPGGAGAMLLPDGTPAAAAAGQGRGAPSRTAITADPLGIRR